MCSSNSSCCLRPTAAWIRRPGILKNDFFFSAAPAAPPSTHALRTRFRSDRSFLSVSRVESRAQDLARREQSMREMEDRLSRDRKALNDMALDLARQQSRLEQDRMQSARESTRYTSVLHGMRPSFAGYGTPLTTLPHPDPVIWFTAANAMPT